MISRNQFFIYKDSALWYKRIGEKLVLKVGSIIRVGPFEEKEKITEIKAFKGFKIISTNWMVATLLCRRDRKDFDDILKKVNSEVFKIEKEYKNNLWVGYVHFDGEEWLAVYGREIPMEPERKELIEKELKKIADALSPILN